MLEGQSLIRPLVRLLLRRGSSVHSSINIIKLHQFIKMRLDGIIKNDSSIELRGHQVDKNSGLDGVVEGNPNCNEREILFEQNEGDEDNPVQQPLLLFPGFNLQCGESRNQGVDKSDQVGDEICGDAEEDTQANDDDDSDSEVFVIHLQEGRNRLICDIIIISKKSYLHQFFSQACQRISRRVISR